MRKEEGKRSVVIIVLLLLVATISVGYALMSTNLLIKGTTSINAETWDVHFTNLINTSASCCEFYFSSSPFRKYLIEKSWIVLFYCIFYTLIDFILCLMS